MTHRNLRLRKYQLETVLSHLKGDIINSNNTTQFIKISNFIHLFSVLIPIFNSYIYFLFDSHLFSIFDSYD